MVMTLHSDLLLHFAPVVPHLCSSKTTIGGEPLCLLGLLQCPSCSTTPIGGGVVVVLDATNNCSSWSSDFSTKNIAGLKGWEIDLPMAEVNFVVLV